MVLSWQGRVQVMQRTRVVANGVLSHKGRCSFAPAAATVVCRCLFGMAGGCEGRGLFEQGRPWAAVACSRFEQQISLVISFELTVLHVLDVKV